MKRIAFTTGLAVVGLVGWFAFNTFYRVIVVTDHHPHRSQIKIELKDDDPSELRAEFDPNLVDRRLLDEWEVNSSAATLRLDCPDMKVDRHPTLNVLYPSYADAMTGAENTRFEFLPSANLIDGAAKQFDDGMYAAIDIAIYKGQLDEVASPVDVVEEMANALAPESEAKACLAAALELAGRKLPLPGDLDEAKRKLLSQFEQNESLAKPISFYTWNDDLKWIWRFSKFLQREFPDTAIPNQLAAALNADTDLREAYQSLITHANRMTNPAQCLSLAQLGDGESLEAIAKTHSVPNAAVAVFPASTSKETELFNRLFVDGLPQNTNLMTALIERILSGGVNLEPRDGSGWYDHQIYALETLLLPSEGAENDKLLLTARYKKRLLEAFKSMTTKRRETHARQLGMAATASAPPPPKVVQPRLRVEPCATFYLRTARAYRFIANFLESSLGSDNLNQLIGLRAGAERETRLAEELNEMSNRFYGLYLVVCDDIGMKPDLAEDESVDTEACYELANQWLERIKEDTDLAKDTRVSVPIAQDMRTRKTRLWATLGVRLARLNVYWQTPPKIRPQGESEWQNVEPSSTKGCQYVIAVDEFAELELNGFRSLNRSEFRAICDEHKTREAICNAVK